MEQSLAFGQVLRRFRKEAGLTQEQLSLEADVERNFVSLIERGVNQPTIRVLFKLAKALGTTPSQMLLEVESMLSDHD